MTLSKNSFLTAQSKMLGQIDIDSLLQITSVVDPHHVNADPDPALGEGVLFPMLGFPFPKKFHKKIPKKLFFNMCVPLFWLPFMLLGSVSDPFSMRIWIRIHKTTNYKGNFAKKDEKLWYNCTNRPSVSSCGRILGLV